MVGDRWLDVACGVAAGTRAIRVLSGHGAAEPEASPLDTKASAILGNLMEAAGWILRNSPR
jgi:phosphoglycolate phosphatase-like HAD superfamily hydrolase